MNDTPPETRLLTSQKIFIYEIEQAGEFEETFRKLANSLKIVILVIFYEIVDPVHYQQSLCPRLSSLSYRVQIPISGIDADIYI